MQSPNWFFGQCRADHFLEKFFVLVSVTAHDPDKPIISALGFLGKLPGGKCFSLLMQPLSNTRFQKVEFLSKNPKISINFLISNFQLKILNFLNHIRFQFGEKLFMKKWKKIPKFQFWKKKYFKTFVIFWHQNSNYIFDKYNPNYIKSLKFSCQKSRFDFLRQN